VIEYRVSKYNPALRDSSGAYTVEEWTSVSDIGRSFDGVNLTQAEYQRVESAYVSAALAFLGESGVSELKVQELENPQGLRLEIEEGSTLPLERAAEVIRALLREEFWCLLKAEGGSVHMGYDYLMSIRVPRRCPAAEKATVENGLFVERFEV
jgi:hypothetical protein